MVTTTRNTLVSVKDSCLAAMFSGRHKLTMHNGRYFIDRDGEAFTNMLSYLRTGRIPYFVN
jgi:frataxin-like iron-binding protein CyaY